MGALADSVRGLTSGRALDTSDQALDGAAGFQQGFRSYLPLYNDYTGSYLSLETDIQGPYDELREIDYAALAEIAEQCGRAGDDFAELFEDVEKQVGAVDGWSGAAADAFRDHVRQLQAATGVIEDDLRAIATATADAVSAAEQVVVEYVDKVRDIDFAGFDQPGELRYMIEVERLLRTADEVTLAVNDWLGERIGVPTPLPGSGPLPGVDGERPDSLGRSADAFLEWIAGKVRDYLDVSFRARFESNLDLLRDAVEGARSGLGDALHPMVVAAGSVTESPFAAQAASPEYSTGIRAGSAPGGLGPERPQVGDVPGQPADRAHPADGPDHPAGPPPDRPTRLDTILTGEHGPPGSSLIGEHGRPDRVPVHRSDDVPASTVAAAVGFGMAPDADPTGFRGVVSGWVSGGASSLVSGEVGDDGPSYASTGNPGGQVASGSIGSGPAGGPGAAQLPSVGDSGSQGGAQLPSAEDTGAPGGARLPSVGDGLPPGQGGGTASPMMPMAGGTVTGGEQERRPGGWQMPAADLFDAGDAPGKDRPPDR